KVLGRDMEDHTLASEGGICGVNVGNLQGEVIPAARRAVGGGVALDDLDGGAANSDENDIAPREGPNDGAAQGVDVKGAQAIEMGGQHGDMVGVGSVQRHGASLQSGDQR